MLLDFHSEIYSLIRGGIFVLFIYHLLIFFQNKSKLYLFYSLYLLVMSIFLLEPIISEWSSPNYYYYTTFALQFIAYATYIEFTRDLLDTRGKLLGWDKYLTLEIKILLLLTPIFIIIQLLFGFEFQKKAFLIIAILLIIFTFYTFYIILTRIRDVSGKYFVVATLFYLALGFVGLLLVFEIIPPLGAHPLFFIYTGTIIQCLLLSVVLGSIIKKIEQKSKNAEIRLALKLKEMEELKMTALQSQMNPHFLFNSLNSINNFVLKNDIEKASDYITKFSKLIRVILNSSSSLTSTLSEELRILALYVKLEQMRVNGGFDYNVIIDKNLNLETIKVPPLFLQPFIENAIWHGIMKKQGEKTIELSIKNDDGNVKCIIVDNGIGINKAKKIEQMSKKRKFLGAKVTEQRIRILYQNKNVHIKTKDISSSKKTGTQVSISFPLA